MSELDLNIEPYISVLRCRKTQKSLRKEESKSLPVELKAAHAARTPSSVSPSSSGAKT